MHLKSRSSPRVRSALRLYRRAAGSFIFALLLPAILMTGCLSEIHYNSAPGASGRVVDSVDHNPVPNATVALIPDELEPYSENNVTIKVKTSRLGAFHIRKQTDWIVYETRSPADPWVRACAPALLRVQHAGYEPFETNITIGMTEQCERSSVNDDFKAGDICLKRVSQ